MSESAMQITGERRDYEINACAGQADYQYGKKLNWNTTSNHTQISISD